MKKIGLYFGTFNPIHVGHLIIANFMANHTDLDEVWFVVTPQNPFKDAELLLPDFHRLQMVKLAIKENEKLSACDVELSLPRPNYTIDTLNALQGAHPDHSFVIIMGEDNVRGLAQWKSYREILSKYAVYVYPRLSDMQELEELTQEMGGEIRLFRAPLMKISSTFIRESIRTHKDVRYLIPEAVTNYISNNYLYEKPIN